MCDPTKTAEFALGTQIAGGALRTIGAFSDASSQRRAARFNAATARAQAEDARRRGELSVRQHYRDVAQLKGRQRASMAASGVVLTEGSPLAILTQTEHLANLDAQTIQENADRESHAFRMQAANYDAAAQAANPFLAAGSTLLTGASQVADRWAIYKDQGIDPFGF